MVCAFWCMIFDSNNFFVDCLIDVDCILYLFLPRDSFTKKCPIHWLISCRNEKFEKETVYAGFSTVATE